MNELMQLEIQMSIYDDSICDVFCEGVADTVANIVARITGFIKKIIVEMNGFASQIGANIEAMMFSAKVKHMLTKAENDLKRNKKATVTIVNAQKITNLYRKDIMWLRKEVQKIGSELRKFSLRSPGNKIQRYIDHKDSLKNYIDKMIVEISKAGEERITVSASMAKDEITKIMKTQRLYVNEYTKMVSEFEQLITAFDRNTAIAEIDFETRTALQSYLSPLQQLKIGSTKLLRKSVFLVASFTL